MKYLLSSLFLIFTVAALANTAINASPLSYPNGVKKAVIFSYDDGTIQDTKLVDIFNKYQVVGTFNLNSGLFGKKLAWTRDLIGKDGEYITIDKLKSLYKGHEIAGHSYSHPGLAGLNHDELTRQLMLDQQILGNIKGKPVLSFAYPLGSYDDIAMQSVKMAGYTNARTVKDSHNFQLPDNDFAWHPTVHHSQAMPIIEEYLKLNQSNLSVLVIWGHSWEFDKNQANNNWQYADNLVKKIAKQEDIWYVSGGEFFRFLRKN